MQRTITIVGAGILGLWQALVLARRGHTVRLVEASKTPFENAASRYAGTLLAPECEFPPVQKSARAFARLGLKAWQENFGCVETRGTLVVTGPGGDGDLHDLANQAENAARVTGDDIVNLESALGGRFQHGLFFEHEAHMTTETALQQILDAVRNAGVALSFGTSTDHNAPRSRSDILIDCRGMAARDQLDDLRGVRGERVVIKTNGLALTRPVRLLHLRQPIYVVPWPDHQFMVGATTIESEDTSAVSVKSALDLLTQAYHLHPAFGEAEIISLDASVRPAFPDNLPRITVRDGGRTFFVNGAYRHGFLLAPVLAEATADFIEHETPHPWLKLEAETCSQAEAH